MPPIRIQSAEEAEYQFVEEAIVTGIAIAGHLIQKHIASHYDKRAFHKGLYTAPVYVAWMLDVAHPTFIYVQLGVHRNTFLNLVRELETTGQLLSSRDIDVREQLATFLFITRVGCGVRLAGNVFLRSNESISHSFKTILYAFSSAPIYTHWVRQGTALTPPSTKLSGDTRFKGYFDDCVGAIDGTLLPAHVPKSEQDRYRSRKGKLQMNCLAVCTFELLFAYVLAGYEGSAPDSTVFKHAKLEAGLEIPEGKFLLGDAGYGLDVDVLVPYRGVRYHLQEWEKARRADQQPTTPEELFNLRHACARNAIERIFGVVKRKWKILIVGCEYSLEHQALLVNALCCLYNIIRTFAAHDEELKILDDLPSDTRVFQGKWRDAMDSFVEKEVYDRRSRNHQPASHINSDGELLRHSKATAMWDDYKKGRDLRRRVTLTEL